MSSRGRKRAASDCGKAEAPKRMRCVDYDVCPTLFQSGRYVSPALNPFTGAPINKGSPTDMALKKMCQESIDSGKKLKALAAPCPDEPQLAMEAACRLWEHEGVSYRTGKRVDPFSAEGKKMTKECDAFSTGSMNQHGLDLLNLAGGVIDLTDTTVPQSSSSSSSGSGASKGRKKKKSSASASASVNAYVGPMPNDISRPILKNSLGNVLDVFPLTAGQKRCTGYAGFERSLQSGQAVYFGPNREIVFRRFLGAGVYGAVFLGSYGTYGSPVALKIDKIPNATFNPGGKIYRMTKEGDGRMIDAIREYTMMKNLGLKDAKANQGPMTKERLKTLGPVVGVVGMAAVATSTTVHTIVAMEAMDTTLKSFVKTVIPKWKFDAHDYILAKLILALKALRNIRKIHGEGYEHMDAHSENWLVNYTGVSQDIWYVDIRTADLGMSCRFKGKKDVNSCEYKAEENPDNAFNRQWLFHGAVEYSQFCYSTIGTLFSDITPRLPPEFRQYWAGLMKDVSELHQAHFNDYLDEAYKLSALIDSFEAWFSPKRGYSAQHFIWMLIGLQSPAAIKKMIAEELIPRNWETAWK